MKTIILEDEGIMALFLKESLEELGHEVLATFRNAEGLFDYLSTNNKVDLIFLDILIDGGLDGLQVGQVLAKSYNNISLVFITSYKDSDTIQSAQEVNPLGYLIKPIECSDLEAILMIVKSARKNIVIENSSEVKIENYIYNTNSKNFYEDGEFIKLSSLEISCIEYLIKNKNSYVSHEYLINNLWHGSTKSESSLRELIYRIRKKLPKLKIISTPNIGYSLLS